MKRDETGKFVGKEEKYFLENPLTVKMFLLIMVIIFITSMFSGEIKKKAVSYIEYSVCGENGPDRGYDVIRSGDPSPKKRET